MPLPQSLIDQVPHCFGAADKVFAGNAEAKSNARNLLADLIKNKNTLDDLVREMETFMKTLSLGRYHLTTQTLRAKNLETYW